MGDGLIYRWDDFELDTEAFSLTQNGSAVAVEPRVLDFIHWLAAHPGRLVTKDELIHEVWKDQIVGEAALSRCVYEARRALGDDAKQQRYVATVHGRGFRFVGEVVSPGAEPAIPPRASEQQPTPALRARRPIVTAALLVVLLLAVLAFFRLPRSPERGFALSERPIRVGILPASTVEEGSLPMVAQALTEYLTVQLGLSPELQLVSPDRVESVVLAAETLEAAAAELALDLMLEARLEPATVPERAVVDVDLYWTDGRFESAPLGRFEIDVPASSDRLRRFNRQRARIVEELALALELESLPPLSPSRDTDRVEAFQKSHEARRSMLDNFCSGTSLTLAREATELDPDYAHAWGSLTAALYAEAWACGRQEEHFDDAYAAAERALELAPELEARVRMFEIDLMLERGRLEEAWQLVRTMESRELAGVLATSGGYVLRWAGFLEQAEKRMRADLEVNPQLYLDLSGMVPNPLLYQGRYDEFLELLPGGDSTYHRFYRGWALYLSGETEQATDVLRKAFRDHPNDLYGRFSQALLALAEGDLEAARAIVVQLERQRQEMGHVDGEVTYKQAQLLAAAGDREGARRNLERAVAYGFVCSPCFRGDPILAGWLQDADFAPIVVASDERRRDFAERFELPL